MQSWRQSTLDQLGRIVTGKTPPTSDPDNYGGLIPFVTPSDMDGQRKIGTVGRTITAKGALSVKNSIVPAGAVAVSCIGSDMGKAAIVSLRSVTNQQINCIVTDATCDPLFVYYNLSARKAEIRASASGSAQPILNKSAFGRMRITLPPVTEQRAIAATLGALDDKIELNRRMNETLEAMARALFRDWFVDFGPTRAKMAGLAPYLSPALWDLFPDRLDDDGKPQGWEVSTISLICQSVTRGVTPKYSDGSNFWAINQKVNKGSTLEWQHAKELSLDLPIKPTQLAEKWDVLVNSLGEGTLGRVHLFKEEEGRYAVDQHMSICRGETDLVSIYLYHVLSSHEGQLKIESLKSGSTGMSMLNVSKLRDYDLLLPSNQALTAFRNISIDLLERVAENERETRTLAQTRDLLLPRLMSGELSILKMSAIIESAL